MSTHVPLSDPSSTLANRYQLLRELGSGGYGVVYEALDAELGERVALKTLQRMEPDALLRFKDEFRSLQDVEHPNLVHLVELTCADGLWFLTMELVDGTDFFDHVRPRRRDVSYLRVRSLHEYRLRGALSQLLAALSAIHASGRVHCDIKPPNIRVDASGRLVLLDFGLVTGGRMDQTSENIFGTPGYMAPEQSRGEPPTPAADMYAVGVLLYEALTGELPHVGDTTRVLSDKQHLTPTRPEELSPEVPSDLAEVCMRLLQVDPLLRPSAPEVLALLARDDGIDLESASSEVRLSVPDAPFIGREEPLRWLGEHFEQTRAGTPWFVYLSGDSGVGKSTLASQFARRQADAGAIVLRGRCFERETVPYKAFDGIVDELALLLSTRDPDRVRALLPFDAKLLVQIFPVLSRVRPIAEQQFGRSTQDPNVQRAHTFAALREILARLALEQPLLLVIDDLQWSDLDSLRLMDELLTGPEAPGCMVLTTGRPVDQLSSELHTALTPLLATATSAELPLPGLDQKEAEALGSALARDTHQPEFFARIAREAKGHPLFMAELVRHVEGGHVLDSGEETHLDDALRTRVEQLDAVPRALMESLAVAGMPLHQNVLMHALRVSPTALARRIAQLRVAHLVRSEDRQRTECYHDRIRSAVLDQLSADTRRARHRALAEALSALGNGTDEQVAYQWRCAGELARAARYCAQAADKAFQALAFQRAAALYENALAEASAFEPEELTELRVAYARALSCAGFAGRAAEVYLLVSQARSGESARALRRQATLLMLRSGRINEGLQLADDVLSEVGLSRPSTPARAVVRLLWERARLAGQGLHYDVAEVHNDSASRAEVLELLWAVAPSLAFVDFMGGSALQSQYARLSLQGGDIQHVIRSLTVEAMLRSTADAPPQAQVTRILQQVRQIAADRDSPYLRALVFMSHGYVHWQSFRLSEASAQLVQAERLLSESCVDAGWELTNARIGLLNALWNAGHLWKHDELSRAWQRDARDRGDRYAATQLLCMGVGYQLSLKNDDPEGAERALQESVRGWPEAFQLPQWSQYVGRQLVALYKGEGEAYGQLRQNWAQLRGSQLLRASYLAFLTYTDAAWACLDRAARSPRSERGRLLAEARRFARKVSETKRPLADALADQICAQVLVLSDQPEEAVGMLRSAEAEFRAHHSVYQFPTGYLMGRLLGGAEGQSVCTRALTWATGEGVMDPERWFAMFVPVLRMLSDVG